MKKLQLIFKASQACGLKNVKTKIEMAKTVKMAWKSKSWLMTEDRQGYEIARARQGTWVRSDVCVAFACATDVF